MISLPCQYEGPPHEFPDDWEFGGADGEHPGADPRYKPTTYHYYNDQAQVIFTTQTFLCDDEAIDKFTKVSQYGKSFNPVWVSATRYLKDGSRVVEMLPWTYDKDTDTATERANG